MKQGPAKKREIKELRPEELDGWLAEQGERAFRAEQIRRWLWSKGARSFDEMTNLSRGLRANLDESFSLEPLRTVTDAVSSDGTRKFLFALDDDRRIESVLIPQDRSEHGSPERRTLCISSQVGCAMGCAFCATATLGLGRNLRADEIAGQVLEVSRTLPPQRPITNVVFMGMGEPLHNYDPVVRAIEILTADWGLGFSHRRITVSTVGLVPRMEQLLRETQVNLAVSLTGTTDETRNRLMPVNRKYSLDELARACRDLPMPRRKRITFEYVMLDGENDQPEDVERLASFLEGIRSKVNLIPFNPFPGTSFRSSPRARIEGFRQALNDRGILATIRESRGQDIDAACGQLAARDRAAA